MIEHILRCLGECKHLKRQQKDAIIDIMTSHDFDNISTIIEHILGKQIKLPKQELKRMKKNKSYLYALLKGSKIKCSTKKEILKKKGGVIAPWILKRAAT
jgi:hypothetical protein